MKGNAMTMGGIIKKGNIIMKDAMIMESIMAKGSINFAFYTSRYGVIPVPTPWVAG